MTVSETNPVADSLNEIISVYGAELVLRNAYNLLGDPGVEPQVAEVTHVVDISELVDSALTKLTLSLGVALDTASENAGILINRLGDIQAAKDKAQAAKGKGVPAEYFKILGPEGLDYTFSALDSAVTSQLEAGNKREAAHRDRSTLVKRRSQLETSIKLTEAEAIMNIVGTGKDAYVMIGDKMTYMPNDTARDAYRRTVSKADREELAQVNGEIASIEADIVRAKDSWDTAKELSDTLRARANLQTALLNFIASRG